MNSMTACSRRELRADWGQASCELRTLNHRHLDLSLHLDEPVRVLEPVLRREIQAVLQRGRVECTLRCQLQHPAGAAQAEGLPIDDARLQELLRTCERVLDGTIWQGNVNPVDLLKWPGVLQAPSVDAAQLQAAIVGLLGATLKELQVSRRREGQALVALIAKRGKAAQAILQDLQGKLPDLMAQQRDRLLDQLESLAMNLEESLTAALKPEHLASALLTLAHKYDVTEELERLEIHLQTLDTLLHEEEEPVGRRLDFLMQELHREANTLGNKSIHAEITEAAMELKVLTEQMREQARNLE